MQDNNNNPFQTDQPQLVRVDSFDTDDPTPVTPEPLPGADKKTQVALDGVSPNYDTYDQPLTELEPAPVMDANQTEDTAMPQPDDIQPQEVITESYVNPLINNEVSAPYNPINTVPELADPNQTAIEINPKNGAGFKAWQFFLVLGIAIIGIAGAIFFLVEYNQTNASFQDSLSQLEGYRNKADTADKATQQLESLQKTIRDQAEKITTLQEENDTLKKTQDELKTANEEIKKQKDEIKDLQDKLIKLLP